MRDQGELGGSYLGIYYVLIAMNYCEYLLYIRSVLNVVNKDSIICVDSLL